MYIHIGSDFVVFTRDVIGIFDFDGIMSSSVSKDYLMRLEKDGRLVSISEDIPKSVVVAVSGGEDIAYLSPLNSKTIQNRKF